MKMSSSELEITHCWLDKAVVCVYLFANYEDQKRIACEVARASEESAKSCSIGAVCLLCRRRARVQLTKWPLQAQCKGNAGKLYCQFILHKESIVNNIDCILTRNKNIHYDETLDLLLGLGSDLTNIADCEWLRQSITVRINKTYKSCIQANEFIQPTRVRGVKIKYSMRFLQPILILALIIIIMLQKHCHQILHVCEQKLLFFGFGCHNY